MTCVQEDLSVSQHEIIDKINYVMADQQITDAHCQSLTHQIWLPHYNLFSQLNKDLSGQCFETDSHGWHEFKMKVPTKIVYKNVLISKGTLLKTTVRF